MSIAAARALPGLSPDVIAKRMVLAAAVLAATVASSSWAARAEELGPLQAVSLRFGDTNGVAYYAVQGASYHVVATLAAERGTPPALRGQPVIRPEAHCFDPGQRGSEGADHRALASGQPPAGQGEPDGGRVRHLGIASVDIFSASNRG